MMRLLAVNVGKPRLVAWRGEQVLTSIFKKPVVGLIRVADLNIDGDQQADLSVHGGPHKAVYAYPAEHYPAWRVELGMPDLGYGGFGENLTVAGLTETSVGIGDRYRIGTVELTVTQPRSPCFKLNVRFNRPDMVRRFHASGRSGFYLSVTRAGDLEAGQPITRVHRDERGLTVADVVRLHASESDSQELIERAAAHPDLAPEWRQYFQQRRWRPDH